MILYNKNLYQEWYLFAAYKGMFRNVMILCNINIL